MVVQLRALLFALLIVQARPQYRYMYKDAVVPLPASWLPSYMYFKYGYYPRIRRNYASNSLENLKTARSYLDQINDQTMQIGMWEKMYANNNEAGRPKRNMFRCDFSMLTPRSILSILRYSRMCGLSTASLRFGLGRK